MSRGIHDWRTFLCVCRYIPSGQLRFDWTVRLSGYQHSISYKDNNPISGQV